jgi:hypothetical protein
MVLSRIDSPEIVTEERERERERERTRESTTEGEGEGHTHIDTGTDTATCKYAYEARGITVQKGMPSCRQAHRCDSFLLCDNLWTFETLDSRTRDRLVEYTLDLLRTRTATHPRVRHRLIHEGVSAQKA